MRRGFLLHAERTRLNHGAPSSRQDKPPQPKRDIDCSPKNAVPQAPRQSALSGGPSSHPLSNPYVGPSSTSRVTSNRDTAEENDPLHSTISLLPFGGPTCSTIQTLVISHLPTLALLARHPTADIALPSSHSLVRLVPMPRKGLGLVTTRPIQAGEVLVCERPLLVLPSVVRQDVLLQLPELVRHLPEERRKALERMYNPWPGTGVEGVHRGNCVSLDLTEALEECQAATQEGRGDGREEIGNVDGMEHTATYEWIGRANHSCAPNARVGFDGKTFQGTLKALSPLTEGEEVCISYLSDDELHLATAERRARLLEGWAFLCQCERCALE